MYCVFDSPWHWCQDTQGYMDITIGMKLQNTFAIKLAGILYLLGERKEVD